MLHCSREFLIGNHNLQKFLMSFIQTTERSLTLSRVRLKYTSMTLKAKSCFDADFFSSSDYFKDNFNGIIKEDWSITEDKPSYSASMFQ